MNADAWEKVSTALDQLLDLTEAERQQYLHKLRQDDPALCTEVESLLQQEQASERLQALPPPLLEQVLAPTAPGGLRADVPKQLGGYRIVKVLGSGGMGVVYQAEDPTLQRSVALKVMKREFASLPQARERFLREAQAAAALHHDHILPIYHVGDEGGTAFLVMPLLQGETLEDRLRRTPTLPVAEILRIGQQIAAGLAAAHARGLIHRDIKPANIWLEGEPMASPGRQSGACRVKIMDFGLARPMHAETHLTQSGVILGTPAYMAPEQGRGEDVDGRSDLFSVGCVLYRLATGKPPFQKKDALSTAVAAATETPPAPSQINPQLPVALSRLIMELLAKSPDVRPASAQRVADRLAALASGTPLPALGAAAARRGLRTGGLIAAALAAGALSVGAGVWLMRGEPEAPHKDERTSVPVPPAAKTTTTALSPGDPLVDGQEFATLPGAVWRVAFARDGKWIYAAAANGAVVCWEAGTGQRVFTAQHAGQVVSMDLSHDGKILITGARDHTIRCWDARTGMELRRLENPPNSDCWSLCASPVADLAVGSIGDESWVWDLQSGQAIKKLPYQGSGVTYLPKGDAFLTGGTRDVYLVALDLREPPRLLETPVGWVRRAVASRDGRYAATGHGNAGNHPSFAGDDYSVRLWDVQDGRLRKRFAGLKHTTFGLAFTPDSKRLFAACFDGSIHLYDVENAREIWCKEGSAPLYDIAVAPDGQSVLTSDLQGRVMLYRLRQ